jgi:beta-galactosidase/beta-glucuronidase
MAAANTKVRTVIFDAKGKKVAEEVTPVKAGGDWTTVTARVQKPLLWSAETPNLYKAEFSLLAADGSVLHRETKSFGFRTIEVKESDGMYINGVRGKNPRGEPCHSLRRKNRAHAEQRQEHRMMCC